MGQEVSIPSLEVPTNQIYMSAHTLVHKALKSGNEQIYTTESFKANISRIFRIVFGALSSAPGFPIEEIYTLYSEDDTATTTMWYWIVALYYAYFESASGLNQPPYYKEHIEPRIPILEKSIKNWMDTYNYESCENLLEAWSTPMSVQTRQKSHEGDGPKVCGTGRGVFTWVCRHVLFPRWMDSSHVYSRLIDDIYAKCFRGTEFEKKLEAIAGRAILAGSQLLQFHGTTQFKFRLMVLISAYSYLGFTYYPVDAITVIHCIANYIFRWHGIEFLHELICEYRNSDLWSQISDLIDNEKTFVEHTFTHLSRTFIGYKHRVPPYDASAIWDLGNNKTSYTVTIEQYLRAWERSPALFKTTSVRTDIMLDFIRQVEFYQHVKPTWKANELWHRLLSPGDQLCQWLLTARIPIPESVAMKERRLYDCCVPFRGMPRQYCHMQPKAVLRHYYRLSRKYQEAIISDIYYTLIYDVFPLSRTRDMTERSHYSQKNIVILAAYLPIYYRLSGDANPGKYRKANEHMTEKELGEIVTSFRKFNPAITLNFENIALDNVEKAVNDIYNGIYKLYPKDFYDRMIWFWTHAILEFPSWLLTAILAISSIDNNPTNNIINVANVDQFEPRDHAGLFNVYTVLNGLFTQVLIDYSIDGFPRLIVPGLDRFLVDRLAETFEDRVINALRYPDERTCDPLEYLVGLNSIESGVSFLEQFEIHPNYKHMIPALKQIEARWMIDYAKIEEIISTDRKKEDRLREFFADHLVYVQGQFVQYLDAHQYQQRFRGYDVARWTTIGTVINHLVSQIEPSQLDYSQSRDMVRPHFTYSDNNNDADPRPLHEIIYYVLAVARAWIEPLGLIFNTDPPTQCLNDLLECMKLVINDDNPISYDPQLFRPTSILSQYTETSKERTNCALQGWLHTILYAPTNLIQARPVSRSDGGLIRRVSSYEDYLEQLLMSRNNSSQRPLLSRTASSFESFHTAATQGPPSRVASSYYTANEGPISPQPSDINASITPGSSISRAASDESQVSPPLPAPSSTSFIDKEPNDIFDENSLPPPTPATVLPPPPPPIMLDPPSVNRSASTRIELDNLPDALPPVEPLPSLIKPLLPSQPGTLPTTHPHHPTLSPPRDGDATRPFPLLSDDLVPPTPRPHPPILRNQPFPKPTTGEIEGFPHPRLPPQGGRHIGDITQPHRRRPLSRSTQVSEDDDDGLKPPSRVASNHSVQQQHHQHSKPQSRLVSHDSYFQSSSASALGSMSDPINEDERTILFQSKLSAVELKRCIELDTGLAVVRQPPTRNQYRLSFKNPTMPQLRVQPKQLKLSTSISIPSNQQTSTTFNRRFLLSAQSRHFIIGAVDEEDEDEY